MGNEDVNKVIDGLKLNEGLQPNNSNQDKKEEVKEKEIILDIIKMLPIEIVEEIFLKLTPKDLAAVSAVNSSWREWGNSNKIWGGICDRRGWIENLEPKNSYFAKCHKQFRTYIHSDSLVNALCKKRILFSQHSQLIYNWRHGCHVAHNISSSSFIKDSLFKVFEPFTCDGELLVMGAGTRDSDETILAVWNISKVPSHLCNLELPSRVMPVEALTFDYDTIVVTQDWTVIIFKVVNGSVEKAFEKNELKQFAPKDRVTAVKRITPFLKVTQDYIICVPNHSATADDFLPILFWCRQTGDLKHNLSFDSANYLITSAEWFGDSCFLALTNKRGKTHHIIEFGTKSANWEYFNQVVPDPIDQISVNNHYVLAVTKQNDDRPHNDFFWSRPEQNNRDLRFWDRVTGVFVKSFKAQGKGFRFLDESVMYFDESLLTIVKINDPNVISEISISGTITSIRVCQRPSVLVIKTLGFIEVWDLGLGSRLYSVTTECGYGSQLWSDHKCLITYNSANEDTGSIGVTILGFW